MGTGIAFDLSSHQHADFITGMRVVFLKSLRACSGTTPQKYGVNHRKKCTSGFSPDVNLITLLMMKNIVFEIFYQGMFHPYEIQAKLG